MSRADAKAESLSIPANVRAAVDTRDGMHCRVCGRFLGDRRALHHIEFGGGSGPGMGGRRKHDMATIATVCWLPGDGDCHALVHSRKTYFQDLLREVLTRPGLTVLQLERWRRRATTTTERRTP